MILIWKPCKQGIIKTRYNNKYHGIQEIVTKRYANTFNIMQRRPTFLSNFVYTAHVHKLFDIFL